MRKIRRSGTYPCYSYRVTKLDYYVTTNYIVSIADECHFKYYYFFTMVALNL